MPIRPPALDDRSFDDLVTDLVRRIPAHTPEWTNPREGDPGRTLPAYDVDGVGLRLRGGEGGSPVFLSLLNRRVKVG